MYSYGGFDGGPASAKGAFLNLAKFGKANLYGCDLSDTKLRGAGFIEANLVNARLENVDLKSYQGSAPTPASLSKTDLRGTNLAGALMQGTVMTDSRCAPEAGTYKCEFPDGANGTILIEDDFSRTVLGETDHETICSDGSSGPCEIR
jgi:hypothetical protein